MEASGGIGIGIGIGFVIGFVVALAFVGTNQGTTIVENIPDLVYNEPKLAYLESYYDDNTDRLTITLSLTDKNAEYTTADGGLAISVQKDGRQVYSTTQEFVKDDFYSWKNNFGEKITGYRVSINQFFSSGSHDVFVTLVTSDGATFENMHDSFYSLN